MMPVRAAVAREGGGEVDDWLPDVQVLAMLDLEPQGWMVARAVHDGSLIVDFELVYINDAGCRLVGRPRGELVGRRYRDLWPETVHDGTLPFYRSVVETGNPALRNVYYERQSIAGHFEFRVGPYRDGIIVRCVDLRQVTVSPQSAGAVRLYDMLDTAFDGFTVFRPVREGSDEIVDFVCEFVNQVGAKLTGCSVEDVIGHRLSEISAHSWASGLFDRYRTVAETGEPWRQELTYPEIGQVWEIKVGRTSGGHVAVSFREITEQVDKQRQMAESAARAEQAAARARSLESVTAALVAASTTAQVYTAIGSVLRPSAGGQSLALLLRQDQSLRLAYHAAYEPEVVARLHDLPIEHPYPAATVAHTGEPRYLSSLAQFHAAQPDPETAVPPGSRQAWAFLPLTVAGEVLGALVVGYREPRDFDPDTRSTLTALAGLGAQALQRAMLFETSVSIASELQHALLPATLPQTAGLRHAARYLPWTRGAEVGGDWYDIIPISADRVAVVIGDVAGHNTAAAATMGQVRDALRAYAIAGQRPSMVMNNVNHLIRALRLNTMATCCYLQLDVAEGAVTGVLAGHPAPILRDARTTGLVRLSTHPALGVSDSVVYRENNFDLPPAATLVLYTDGLVEDRSHPLDRGLAELCAAVNDAPRLDPAEILDHILASDVGPWPRRDDIALLCLTRNPLER
ncbi:SpoIIE family protein phosphatase [Micromonospora lutea]|uniref:SpoIIE family protein phosphatase n=1 Tax=Micromonospora lutea TaxID=419825 RepID=UPI00194FE0EF|nr:SpoIIE family protein phosphatase [Micromonospora lutea]